MNPDSGIRFILFIFYPFVIYLLLIIMKYSRINGSHESQCVNKKFLLRKCVNYYQINLNLISIIYSSQAFSIYKCKLGFAFKMKVIT